MNYQFSDEHVISPKIYGENGHPLEAFSWLRANDPVHWTEAQDFHPFWAITKHEDIGFIERQPELFASEPRPILMPDRGSPEIRQEMMAQIFEKLRDAPKLMEVLAASDARGLVRSLVQMDPPDHPKYRALVQPWFTPSNLKGLEERLRKITREILDEMGGDGSSRELDFVQDVAVFPPLRLIAALLGVPREDEWRILKLTNELFAGDDPEMKRVGDDPLSLIDTIKDIYAYFTDITDARRANPTEDLASYIANGKIDGEYMPYRELVSYYTIVATAGHETTRTAMAGGLLALLENPDQMDLLRGGSTDILKLAVEEMIRWSTPVTQFCRTATQDVKLRDKDIRAGDNLGLFYASANRDEDVFDKPETFRVDRQPNKHLAFGLGPHMCLGNILARMELRIFFEQLIPRIDEMYINGEPDHLQASFVHGLKHLPIRYRLRPNA